MGNKLTLEEQISELEDVNAALYAQYESFVDELCEIILEGETNTGIGLYITLERIKQHINYDKWIIECLDEI